MDEHTHHARVLVVEDEPAVGEFLRQTLVGAGYSVTVVTSGQEAMERALHADLVLLDLSLPDVAGPIICRRLRSTPALARLPIVILGAEDTPRARLNGLAHDADDYVARPFDSAELLLRVDMLLRSRRIEQALRERTRQLTMLRQLTSTLVNTVAVEELAQRIADAVPEAFGPGSGILGGIILSVDSDRQTVRARAATNVPLIRQALACLDRPLDEVESRFSPPKNLIEEVAATGEQRQADHLVHLVAPMISRPVAWAIERQIGWAGGVAEPIRVHERTIGVFLFAFRKQVKAITSSERALMSDFADSTGVALENVRLYAAAEQLTLTDPLTGVANRRHFDRALADEVARARRLGYPLGMLLIDIDHFKHFNDTHGHQAGDEVLRAVARAIRENVRSTDLVARYGGEEFALLLPGTAGPGVHLVGDKLRSAVRETLGLTLSVGAASADFAELGETGDALVSAADAALYAAKRAGRNRTISAEE